MRTLKILIIIPFFLGLLNTNIISQQLAFPGAEGFGRFASGGRGGSVYRVTNLNDSGTGSFRDAVSQPNRTVVFDVAGIINISSRIVISSNITIAGQTAPGDGVVIYGDGISTSGAHNVIIRYLRIRMGKNGTSGKDAIGLANGSNQIFDHVSVTWGLDETFSISWDGKGTEPTNITISNSIIGQGLQTHSCGGLIQTNGGVSIIKCLYIDNKTRNPKVKGVNQFVNNVIYNWGGGGAYILGDSEGDSYANIEDNYFISGPSTGTAPFTRGNSYFHVYGNNNFHDNNKDGALNGSLIPYTIEAYANADLQPVPYNYPAISRIDINNLVDYIKDNVGATLPARDQVDTLIIGELMSLGKRGALIANETELATGGPGLIFSSEVKTDTDKDGMPDWWETLNGLSINDPSDRNGDINSDGWTNLENYINSITSAEPFMKNPVSLTATAFSDVQVNLTWKEYSNDETGFVVEQSANNSTFTPIATLGANTISYSVTGLTKNTTYYFRVKAFNDTQSSVYSNTASVKTMSNIPINPVPADNSKYIPPQKVDFSWSGAGTFKFYFGTDPENLEWKADLATAAYSITGLNGDTKYYWRVDAVTTETLTGDTWNFNTRKQFPLGIVGHWKFNESVGETASDSSVYKNDGTLVDLDNARWEPGINGNCLSFNGATEMSSVKVAHSDALYFDTNPFTIAFWMKAPATQTECYFIHKGTFAKNVSTGATGKWYGIQYKSSNMYFAVDDDVTKSTLSTASTNFLTDTWVHVVAVRDTVNKMLYLYRNGALVKSQADATKLSIGSEHVLHIGNSSDYTTPLTGYVPFKGSMDDMRIYNYALSATEIGNLYNTGQTTIFGRYKKSKDTFKCYPNPVTTYINFDIFLNQTDIASLKIVDVCGKIIFNQNIRGNSSVQINLQSAKAGIYFAMLESKAGKKVLKFMVVK